MIEFIRIENFKLLLNAFFPLGSLNVLSGLNGMGKSTLIQSLLLLRQSYERNVLREKGLLLSGEYVDVGIGSDVLSVSASSDIIKFIIGWQEEDSIDFTFKYVQDSNILPPYQFKDDIKLDNKSLFNTNFQYLSADRLSPKSHHSLSDFHVNDLKSIGQHGEYTAHFIAEKGSRDLKIKALQHPDARSTSLSHNIDAWMSTITPRIKINTQFQLQFNSVILSYSFLQGTDTTREFKPQNVGFGLSYALPVITSILGAAAGDLLIIENPESHLHPAGQSAIGRLCAIAAQNGVQLIIESHSDHFLNGIRVAVKDGAIDSGAVRLFFLERDVHSSEHFSTVINPKIDEQGRIDCWPNGFFDEWDKQLDQLL